ncbi:MAG TPA: hypothetical protein GX715_14235 [Armatimonadetes bacterium]|jgi:hypothetical protein|nr:hypothetical protein [Armatimonadota bacterium]
MSSPRDKKTKSVWWQPEGWMTTGTVVVVAVVVAYLLFMVVAKILPRVRSIGKVYRSAAITRPWNGGEWRGVPPGVTPSGSRARSRATNG